MNGAICYEGAEGFHGPSAPDGVVMVDKIVYFYKEPVIDETVIHLADGEVLRVRTTVAELRGRINSLIGGAGVRL